MTYVISDELRVISRNLKTKFVHNLSDINLDKLVFLFEIESAAKSKIATTKLISPYLKVIYGDHDYVVIVFKKRWDELVPGQRNLVLLQELLKCDWAGDKIRKWDFQTFYELVPFGNFEDNDQCRDPLAPGEITLTKKPVVQETEEDEEDLILN